MSCWGFRIGSTLPPLSCHRRRCRHPLTHTTRRRLTQLTWQNGGGPGAARQIWSAKSHPWSKAVPVPNPLESDCRNRQDLQYLLAVSACPRVMPAGAAPWPNACVARCRATRRTPRYGRQSWRRSSGETGSLGRAARSSTSHPAAFCRQLWPCPCCTSVRARARLRGPCPTTKPSRLTDYFLYGAKPVLYAELLTAT